MTITLTQAVLLGLFCGIAKCCILYTAGAFMFNTVIFNAVIVGAVLGDMAQAMIIGASLQLIYLGVQITNILYLAAGFFAQKGDTFVEKGNAGGMVRWSIIAVGIIRLFCFGTLITLALYFGSGALQGVLDDIPKFVTNGLSAMGACLPAVGFAITANLISKPKYIPFFFAGFFLIQYTKIGTIPLLMVGGFLTFLYITFTKNEYTGHADYEDDDDEDEDEDDDETADEVKILTKRDVLKSYLIYWTSAEVCHSFERMQAPAFCAALVPALKKFYPNKEDKPHYIEALKRNMTFFNSEAHWGGGPCLGLTLAMEEKKSKNYEALPGEMIMNLKTGLMGPLAGIGDTISWSTLMYLFIGMFLPLAQKGNPLGGIAPILLLTVICFGIGYFLTSKCYTFGYSFAENMLKSGLVNMIIAGASILGLFMMGGLASTYVTVSTPLKFATGAYSTTLQSILDSIAPGILPLIVVLCIWGYLSKVKRNYFAATLGVTIISLVLGCLGLII